MFKAGQVRLVSKEEDFWSFTISNISQRLNIVPYFRKFPLKSKKGFSFEKWVYILTAIKNKTHKNPTVNAELRAKAKTINNQ
jgi:hypothetical protein